VSLRLVQSAPGPAPFDLVICYFVDIRLDEQIKAAWPDAMIVNQTNQAMVGAHRDFGSDKVTPLADVFAKYQLAESDVRNLILVAFSEGNQALRLQLISGVVPSALISIDGIHNSPWPGTKRGQTQNYHVEAYRSFAQRARDGERVFIITHSSIEPPDFAPVRQLVGNILYPDGENPPETPQTIDKYTQTGEFVQNGLLVEGWSGGDENAHIFQAKNRIPAKLQQARAMLDGHTVGFELGTGRNPGLSRADITPWKDEGGGGGGMTVEGEGGGGGGAGEPPPAEEKNTGWYVAGGVAAAALVAYFLLRKK